MDKILHDKIKNKLADYLKREPTENEIINGQTDATLMGWIREDDFIKMKEDNKLK